MLTYKEAIEKAKALNLSIGDRLRIPRYAIVVEVEKVQEKGVVVRDLKESASHAFFIDWCEVLRYYAAEKL